MSYEDGQRAAAALYGVKLANMSGRFVERRPKHYEAAATSGQVEHLFDRFETFDTDSHFPMPGVNHSALG